MNTFVKNNIEKTISFLGKVTLWLTNKLPPKETEKAINSLAPKVILAPEEQQKIRPYLNNLIDAIDSDDILNIALAGGYGSGKSTILKTFQFINKKYSYLNISLATFQDQDDQLDNNKTLKSERNRILEISILQQMFYQVKPSDIPDSRFKRLITLSTWKLFGLAFLFIIWLLSSIVIIKFNFTNYYNPKTWNWDDELDWWVLTTFIISFTGIGYFIKTVIRLFKNSKINKLNLKGEIEISESTDKSVFNEHLDEILYFFERKKYDVVIIEDIDRFNSIDLFTKLRELNFLINTSKSINHKVKFIYAVKDDMFKDKNERVKFFDYIIPVVPIINPSNADEKLKTLLSENNLNNQLSVDFISDIITYVNDIDMRLLINIVHEFQIYSSRLSPELDKNKVFANLIYKNLYPKDFGDLIKRNGTLFNLINSKTQYIEILKSSTNERIKELKEELLNIENLALNNVKELRLVYLQYIASLIKNFKAFYVEDELPIIEAAKHDIFFNSIKNNREFKYVTFMADYNNSGRVISSSINASQIKLSEIEKNISKLSYAEREKSVLAKEESKRFIIQKEMNVLEETLNKTDSFSLEEIFSQLNLDDYLNDFDNKLLLRNLIINGYIDEHYEDYITIFHGVNITHKEFEFERNVKSFKKSEYTITINNFENLFKRIPERYHLKPTSWNYSILTYLITNESKHIKRYANLFSSFNDNTSELLVFIDGYLSLNSDLTSNFIKKIFTTNKTLIAYIIQTLDNDSVLKYINLVFKNMSNIEILKFEELNPLNDYLESLDDHSKIAAKKEEVDNLMEYIKLANIKIKKLSKSLHSAHFLTKIYEINGYELTKSNIEVFINTIKSDNDIVAFSHSIFTTIKKNKLEKMLEYIYSSLDDFILNVLLQANENNSESLEVILEILNNDEIDFDLIERFVLTQNTLIEDLKMVERSFLKSFLIENNKIVVSWDNLIDYFQSSEEQDFDSVLVDYLNNPVNNEKLSILKINNIENNDSLTVFCDNILEGKELTNEAHKNLILGIPYVYEVKLLIGVEHEKLLSLVKANKISFNRENYLELKTISDDLAIEFLNVNYEEFSSSINSMNLDESDLTLIFNSTKFSLEEKIQILNVIEDLSLENINLAKAIFNFIPNDYKFNQNNLENLLAVGEDEKKELLLVIANASDLEDDELVLVFKQLKGKYGEKFLLDLKVDKEIREIRKKIYTILRERGILGI